MILELPEKLETALKIQADALGVLPTGYVCEVLQRELAPSILPETSVKPFRSGYGSFAKYGPAPPAEEIDENRADMFRGFGEYSESLLALPTPILRFGICSAMCACPTVP